MEMDAPFNLCLMVEGWWLREGQIEVLVACEGAIRSAGDHLVEINVVSESLQCATDFRIGSHLQGGTEVQFADLDAVQLQTAHRIVWRLEFHGFFLNDTATTEILID